MLTLHLLPFASWTPGVQTDRPSRHAQSQLQIIVRRFHHARNLKGAFPPRELLLPLRGSCQGAPLPSPATTAWFNQFAGSKSCRGSPGSPLRSQARVHKLESQAAKLVLLLTATSRPSPAKLCERPAAGSFCSLHTREVFLSVRAHSAAPSDWQQFPSIRLTWLRTSSALDPSNERHVML